VVHEIFRFLPHQDLLRVRLVGLRIWREKSTKVLIQRNSIKIIFTFSKARDSFVLSRVSTSWVGELDDEKEINLPSSFSLSDLNDLLCASSLGQELFPCVSFGFLDGDLRSPDLQQFLTLHSSKLKGLELDLFSHGTTKELRKESGDKFRTLIRTQVPALEVLCIRKIDELDSWRENMNDSLDPPSSSSSVPAR